MIQVDNVVKTYLLGRAATSVLRGVTCTFPTGSFAFIVGPSGSGKSTLLHLLGALDVSTSGEIFWDGRPLSRMPAIERDRMRREEIGFIFQSFNLLKNLTAVDNVLVPFLPTRGGRNRRDEAISLLKRVGLGDRLHHRPGQLSGGEQQRVAIARALLKEPQLILADEPTGELDSQNGAQIFELLRELQEERGATVITVTHDHRYIRANDLVLEILDGQLLPRETSSAQPA